MNELEINADDSSDEEEIQKITQEYDLKTQHDLFLDAEKPDYIQENDPEGYSFLAYALGVNQFYSPAVSKHYYEKKAALGETELNVADGKLEEWFLKTIHSTVTIVFELNNQKDLSNKVAKDFLKQNKNYIDINVKAWIKHDLRYFFRQLISEDMLPQINRCLKPIKEKIHKFIGELEIEKKSFGPPLVFDFNDFDSAVQDYMKNFFVDKKFMRENERFALHNEWPQFKSKNPVEKTMIERAVEYKGNQNISHVTIEFKKEIFKALLEQELKRGKKSILEKIQGRYHLKQKVTQELVEDSPIYFLFNSGRIQKYLFYNQKKFQQELNQEVENYFRGTFRQELKKMQLSIKLERAITAQQYTFISKDAFDFHANLRLSMRLQRRRIRQARDDEERETISGESFQSGWQFGKQNHIALEVQEISTKGARNDQVSNLETYGRINAELATLKEDINKSLKNSPKLNGKLIADWVRDITVHGEPVAKRAVKDKGETSFNAIPERFQKTLLKLLVNLSYLLLGCEVQRNPASLVIHQMALDLIGAGELTWTQAISDVANEKNFGGGAIPMTMGGYKKDDDKKATAHPVSCARALHDHYGLFAVKPWRYDGESSKEIANNEELVKRENQLVKRWFTLKALSDKPLKQKITAVEEAINSRWYPSGAKN